MSGKVNETLWGQAKQTTSERYPELGKENPRYWKRIQTIYKSLGGELSEKAEKSLATIIEKCDMLEKFTPPTVMHKSLWMEVSADLWKSGSDPKFHEALQLVNYISEGGKFIQKSNSSIVGDARPVEDIVKSNVAMNFGNNGGGERVIELIKAIMGGEERPGHKYIKRVKSPTGNYRYYYEDLQGKVVNAAKPAEQAGKPATPEQAQPQKVAEKPHGVTSGEQVDKWLTDTMEEEYKKVPDDVKSIMKNEPDHKPILVQNLMRKTGFSQKVVEDFLAKKHAEAEPKKGEGEKKEGMFRESGWEPKRKEGERKEEGHKVDYANLGSMDDYTAEDSSKYKERAEQLKKIDTYIFAKFFRGDRDNIKDDPEKYAAYKGAVKEGLGGEKVPEPVYLWLEDDNYHLLNSALEGIGAFEPKGGAGAGEKESKPKGDAGVDKHMPHNKVADNMTNDKRVGLIMDYEEGNLSEKEQVVLFSNLVKTGMAWSLQGAYGRQAKRLIDAGYLDKSGKILKMPEGAAKGEDSDLKKEASDTAKDAHAAAKQKNEEKKSKDEGKKAEEEGYKKEVGSVTNQTMKKINPSGQPNGSATAAEDLTKTPFRDIVSKIRKDWKNVSSYAEPYLDAISSMNEMHDKYGADSGEGMVAYFLANAAAWKGDVAKAVKKELKARLDKFYKGKGIGKSFDQMLAERLEKGDLSQGGSAFEKGGADFHAKDERKAHKHYKFMSDEEKDKEEKKKLKEMSDDEKEHAEHFEKKKKEGHTYVENGKPAKKGEETAKSQGATMDMTSWVEERKAKVIQQYLNSYPQMTKSQAEGYATTALETMFKKGLR